MYPCSECVWVWDGEVVCWVVFLYSCSSTLFCLPAMANFCYVSSQQYLFNVARFGIWMNTDITNLTLTAEALCPVGCYNQSHIFSELSSFNLMGYT